MNVEAWMSQPVIAGVPGDFARKAQQVMRAAHIHHMPVIDKLGVLQGIVSDRDLQLPRWTGVQSGEDSAGRIPLELTLRDVMCDVVLTVSPGEYIWEAGQLMLDAHVNAVPVVDAAGAVHGILTLADVVRALLIPVHRHLAGEAPKGPG